MEKLLQRDIYQAERIVFLSKKDGLAFFLHLLAVIT